MDNRLYIFAVTTDLNGRFCTQCGTGGVFWLDNRLSRANQVLKAEEQIKAYKKTRPDVKGFIISTIKNKPDYVNSFYRVD